MLHGVSLNIGVDRSSASDILKSKVLAEETQPLGLDHLCWTGVEGENLHDHSSHTYTEEALAHVASGCNRSVLGGGFCFENVSSYVRKNSEMPGEFVGEMARARDCGILLDVNNVYVRRDRITDLT